MVFIIGALLGYIYSKVLLINLHCMQQSYKVPFFKWYLILVISLSHRFFTALMNLPFINCSYIWSNKCWNRP